MDFLEDVYVLAQGTGLLVAAIAMAYYFPTLAGILFFVGMPIAFFMDISS